MECDKEYFCHLLFYLFDSKKTVATVHWFMSETYSVFALSIETCEYFRRFKSDDFERQKMFRLTKKVWRAEVQALLYENSARTLEELAEALNIGKSTVSNCLHAIEKIQKGGKWISHELFELVIQNRLTFALYCFLVIKRSSFCIKLWPWKMDLLW